MEQTRYEDWQEVMAANVRGRWLMAKAFGQHLAGRAANGRDGRGKLLLVSSVRGRHGSPAGYSAYCTSKGATDSLTKTLATEWGPRGINVNAIAPSVFRSALTDWIFADTEAGPASRERNYSPISIKPPGGPKGLGGVGPYLPSPASHLCPRHLTDSARGYPA